MKLNKTKTKNDTIYYLARSVRKNGKVTSANIRLLGRYSQLIDDHPDPEAYCRELVRKANEEAKSGLRSIVEEIDLNSVLDGSDTASSPTYKNIGFLYLNHVFERLGLSDFLRKKAAGKKTKYSLGDALKLLTFSRILDPHSKKSTYDLSGTYLYDFELSLDDVYRSLDLLDGLSEELQSHIYKSASSMHKHGSVLYYDCTNYYFETESEDEDGLREYGVSKEHRPNPIVQMGLFIDGDGLPIAFDISKGNTNEQKTAVPLEKRIIKDYGKSKFVYCSDAGLSSAAIKRFNSFQSRSFIVTQSLKKITEKERDLIFEDLNWKYAMDDSKASLRTYEQIAAKLARGEGLGEEERKAIKGDLIYKDYPREGERLIVTFSLRSFVYQRAIFDKQVKRAEGKVKANKMAYQAQDVRRLIDLNGITEEGEMTEDVVLSLSLARMEREAKYHGFYCCATNLEDDIRDIIKVNKARWKIEDCFRTMKTTFKARPVYLQKESHIKAHFFTCYLALVIFTLLKLKMKDGYTNDEILSTLRCMNITVNEKADIGKSLYMNSAVLASLESTYKMGLDRRFYLMSKLKKLAK